MVKRTSAGTIPGTSDSDKKEQEKVDLSALAFAMATKSLGEKIEEEGKEGTKTNEIIQKKDKEKE